MFQAESISKPVAAMAALRIVEKCKLSLDADVNQALTSWKILPRKGASGDQVTLRDLLKHTSGLTLNGLPGYFSGVFVPTLLQALKGEMPANTDPPGRAARALFQVFGGATTP